MIYQAVSPGEPFRQGDLFFGVPRVELDDSQYSHATEAGEVEQADWTTWGAAGSGVSALVGLRSVVAILGSQDCDAARARELTLFEVRPFRDVEGRAKDTKAAKGWVSILVQHARVNQKWFYLPPDAGVGIDDRMAVDFMTPLRVPRRIVDILRDRRTHRLNDVAYAHFRERLAEFFRRYPYDEWYPLGPEEYEEYSRNYTDAEPFPWQLKK